MSFSLDMTSISNACSLEHASVTCNNEVLKVAAPQKRCGFAGAPKPTVNALSEDAHQEARIELVFSRCVESEGPDKASLARFVKEDLRSLPSFAISESSL